MGVEHLGVIGVHPSPRPSSGDYNLYVLSTDKRYYLQTDSEEIDLTGLGIAIDTNDPTGIVDRVDSDMSFDNGTRTFTIEPAVSTFDYYIKGTKYTKNSAQDVVITDTEGLHFIYFDAATLTAVSSPTVTQIETLIKEKALVSVVYWNATNDEQILLAEERHGCSMSGETHYRAHKKWGTVYYSGAAITGLLTEEAGSSNSHAQFGVAVGEFADEDIGLSRTVVTSTTGLPVYYKLGASGNWRRELNAGFSIITTGTGRAAYNEWTGSTWQKTETTNTKFICVHLFMINDTTYQYAAIMGENEYNTKSEAQAGALTELTSLFTAGMPFVEFRALATIILQTSDSYSNDVKTRTREVDTGVDYVDWRTVAFSSASGITGYVDPLTVNGDVLIRAGGVTTRLAVGVNGKVLKVASGLPSWQDESGGSSGLPTKYLENIKTVHVSATTVRILADDGSCRSDDDTFDMVPGDDLDVVITSAGDGGLDTGSEVTDTVYYIWLIYDSTGETYAAMLSLNATSPTMPGDYDKKRRVGSCFNNSSDDIEEFRVEGNYGTKLVIYDRYLEVLSSGSSESWTTVNCSPECPATSRLVLISARFYTLGEGGARITAQGAHESTYIIRVAGESQGAIAGFCPMDTSQRIKYRIDDDFFDELDIGVIGYQEDV